MSERIDLAYEHCAEITRQRARNFYYGLRLTPEPKRSAIYSVYAWMRIADDQVDEAVSISEKHQRLGDFEEATQRLFNGADLGPSEKDPVWVAFRETVRRYGIDPDDLRALVDGLRLDLDHETTASNLSSDEPALMSPTRDELERYCYSVASTVGLICITIWGIREGVSPQDARRLAIQRGLAFQLTNILRDFAEDFDDGRVYLPTNDLETAGITPKQLREWSNPAASAGLVTSLAHWARTQYDESAPLNDMIEPDCQPAICTMTRIYSGLLQVIEREPKRIVGPKRIRLQSARKASIAITTLLGHWMDRRGAAAHVEPRP